MSDIENIVIIGAGNVGTRLAHAFRDAGCRIVQVAGRREDAVKALADEMQASMTLSLEKVVKGQNLYLLALPDDAILEVVPQLGLDNELLVHTSGSMPMNVLAPYAESIGVFYPLQTFSSIRPVSMGEVPILVEAGRIEHEDALLELGRRLSRAVSVADSSQRQRVHIAAVFASNFSNHMYVIAQKLMAESGFGFELLIPLIRETALKALEMGPGAAQTGPAKRKDLKIIEKHLAMLDNNPEWQQIYALLSKSIDNQTKDK